MIARGFTVVELIITITIMGILLLLTVVNVNATQLRARDDERATDVKGIALNLETYYIGGIDSSTVTKRYPTTNVTTSQATAQTILNGIDIKLLKAPGVANVTDTFIPAANTDQTTTGVSPQPTINQYVYQPLLPTGALCTGTAGTEDCRKFNLFYRTEIDNTVKMITSKNQ